MPFWWESKNTQNNELLAKEYYEKGISYCKKKNYTEAIENLEHACKLDNMNYKNLVALSIAYYIVGFPSEKAIENFEKAYKLSNKGNEQKDEFYNSFIETCKNISSFWTTVDGRRILIMLLYRLGLMRKNDGNLEKSADILKQAYELSDNDRLIQNEFEKVIQKLELQKNSNQKYINLAKEYHSNKQYEQAVQAYSWAYQENPNNEEIKQKYLDYKNWYKINVSRHYDKGKAFYEAKQYKKAVKHLELIHNLNPNDLTNIQYLAHSYFNLYNYEKAAELFEKACELNTTNSKNFQWLGLSYYENKDYRQAIKSLEKAQELNSSEFYHFYQLGDSYYQIKNYNQAISQLKKAINFVKQDEKTYLLLGKAYYKNKNCELAIETFIKTLEYNKTKNAKANTYNFLARAYNENKQYDKALEAYEFAYQHTCQNKKSEQKYLDYKNWYETNINLTEIEDISNNITNEQSKKYYEEGVFYYNALNYEIAIEKLNKACELNSLDVNNFHWLGRAYYETQNYEKAIENLKRACELNDNDYFNFYWLGRSYYETKDYKQANENLTNASKLNNQSSHVNYWLGCSFYNLKNYEKAIEVFEKTCILNSDTAINFYQLGRSYYNIKNYEKAVENLEKACKLDNNKVENFYWLGCSYYENKNFENSIETFRKAVKLEPQNISNFYWLACSYYEVGNYNEAIKILNKICKSDPNNAACFYRLGRSYYDIDSYKNAIKAFKTACTLKQNDAYNFYWLGRSYYKDGNFKESIKALEQTYNINPDDEYNIYWLGRSYYKNENFDKAIEIFENIYKSNSNNTHFLQWLGRSYYEIKNYENAIINFEKSKKLNADDPYIFLRLGKAYCDNQNYEKAIENLKQAINTFTDKARKAECYNWIAKAYYNINNKDNALDCYKTACDLEPGNDIYKDDYKKYLLYLSTDNSENNRYKNNSIIQSANKNFSINPSQIDVSAISKYLRLFDSKSFMVVDNCEDFLHNIQVFPICEVIVELNWRTPEDWFRENVEEYYDMIKNSKEIPCGFIIFYDFNKIIPDIYLKPFLESLEEKNYYDFISSCESNNNKSYKKLKKSDNIKFILVKSKDEDCSFELSDFFKQYELKIGE